MLTSGKTDSSDEPSSHWNSGSGNRLLGIAGSHEACGLSNECSHPKNCVSEQVASCKITDLFMKRETWSLPGIRHSIHTEALCCPVNATMMLPILGPKANPSSLLCDTNVYYGGILVLLVLSSPFFCVYCRIKLPIFKVFNSFSEECLTDPITVSLRNV